jgi:hypothetical protein
LSKMLSSWKEIAHFFGKGVRTVQRWEKTLDLPIHRPPGAPSNVVLARTSDLEEWMHRGPVSRATVEEPLLVASDAVLTSLTQLEHEVSFLAQSAGLSVSAADATANPEERIEALTALISQANARIAGRDGAVRAA